MGRIEVHSWRLLVASLIASTTGCPANDEGFSFILPRIPVPSCGSASAGSTKETLSGKEYRFRFTFLRRTPGKKVTTADLRSAYETVCWRVIPANEKAEFLVGDGTTEQFTVIVEAFKNSELVYVGRREGMEIKADGSGMVFMRPTRRASEAYEQSKHLGLSCVDPQRAPRAFHSATLLPNGEVLLYGGLVNKLDGATLDPAEAYASNTVEVYQPNYDPEREYNFRVVVGQSLPRRAFHHAVLLPSDPAGPYYNVLVVGGVMPSDQQKPTPVVRLASEFVFSPHPSGIAAPALLLRYYPAENRIDSQQLDHLPKAMFPAVAVKGKKLAMAGGAATWKDTDPKGFAGEMFVHWIDLDEMPTEKSAALTMKNTRVGHAIALLGTDGQVVVGGHMDGNANDDGEYLPVGTTTFQTTSFPPPVGVTRMASIWHTLTPVGSSDRDLLDGNLPQKALWAGGMLLSDTGNPPNPALRETGPNPDQRPQDVALALVQQDVPPVTTIVNTGSGDTLLPGHFQSVGYHAAVGLYDGSVLLTGGKVGKKQQIAACGTESPYCASNQIKLYGYVQGSFELIAPPVSEGWELNVPRMGHRMTRLLDNSVLITGGVNLAPTKNGQSLTQAELFLPRTGDKTEDLPLDRSADAGPSTCLDRYPE